MYIRTFIHASHKTTVALLRILSGQKQLETNQSGGHPGAPNTGEGAPCIGMFSPVHLTKSTDNRIANLVNQGSRFSQRSGASLSLDQCLCILQNLWRASTKLSQPTT